MKSGLTETEEVKSDLQFDPDLDTDLLDLAMKYSDVFSETIDESRIMDTELMKIELKEDRTVIPIYVTNLRQIPLHWRSQANKF